MKTSCMMSSVLGSFFSSSAFDSASKHAFVIHVGEVTRFVRGFLKLGAVALVRHVTPWCCLWVVGELRQQTFVPQSTSEVIQRTTIHQLEDDGTELATLSAASHLFGTLETPPVFTNVCEWLHSPPYPAHHTHASVRAHDHHWLGHC